MKFKRKSRINNKQIINNQLTSVITIDIRVTLSQQSIKLNKI